MHWVVCGDVILLYSGRLWAVCGLCWGCISDALCGVLRMHLVLRCGSFGMYRACAGFVWDAFGLIRDAFCMFYLSCFTKYLGCVWGAFGMRWGCIWAHSRRLGDVFRTHWGSIGMCLGSTWDAFRMRLLLHFASCLGCVAGVLELFMWCSGDVFGCI